MKKFLSEIYINKSLQVKIILIAGIIFVIFAPYLLTLKWGWREFDLQTGAVGDTIGGITAPIVNLISAILVYYAFTAQIKANELINQQFKETKKDQHINANRDYVYKIFELLKAEVVSIIYTEPRNKHIERVDYYGYEAINKLINLYFYNRKNNSPIDALSMHHNKKNLDLFWEKMDLFDFLFSELLNTELPYSDKKFLFFNVSHLYQSQIMPGLLDHIDVNKIGLYPELKKIKDLETKIGTELSSLKNHLDWLEASTTPTPPSSTQNAQ